MEKPMILSGSDLVIKGFTKLDTTLPEVGLKEVVPNGSWLEQKQIQVALDARKQLIGVERIVKVGAVSHAEWRDNLKLAEVTQKVGCHWQYLGHNVGKQLYLKPEEALYLIETNCLLLKHNEVLVSLEKAYTLLLDSENTLTHYKVYASLSRLGYKLLRHNSPDFNKNNSRKRKSDTSFENVAKVIHKANDKIDDLNEVNEANTEKDNVKVGNNDAAMETDTNNDSEKKILEEGTHKNTTDEGKVKVDENLNHAKEEADNELENNISKDGTFKNTTDVMKVIVNENLNLAMEVEDIETENNNSKEGTCKNTTNEVKNIVDENLNHAKEEADNELENNISKEGTSKNTTDVMKVIVNENLNLAMEVEDIETENNNSKEGTRKNTTNEVKVIIDENLNHAKEEADNELENNISKEGTSKNTTDVMKVIVNENVMHATEVGEQNIDDGSKQNVEKTVETTQETDCFKVNVSADFTIDENGVIQIVNYGQKVPNESQPSCSNETFDVPKEKGNKEQRLSYKLKLQKLRNRKFKPLDPKCLEEYFSNVPNVYRQRVVTVNVPGEMLLPRNIYLNKSIYVINIDRITTKGTSQSSFNNANPQSSDRSYPRYARFYNQNYFRYSWRSQMNYNYYSQYQHAYQQPHMYGYYAPRFCVHNYQAYNMRYDQNEAIRPPNFQNNMYVNSPSTDDVPKALFLKVFEDAALRLRQKSGRERDESISVLNRFIAIYNSKLNERLRLTRDLKIINMNNPTEVVELDGEEESRSKSRRLGDDVNAFDRHLNSIKILAGKLKQFVDKNQSSSRHRRAVSKLIKQFNKSFNADIYMDSEYVIIDRKFINLDSNSDSESKRKTTERKKKLRNPFHILKKMNEQVNVEEPVLNEDDNEARARKVLNSEEVLLKYFDKAWLPDKDDFGRPEVCTKLYAKTHVIQTREEEFFIDFLKEHQGAHENWIDLKTSFFSHLEASSLTHGNQQIEILSKDFFMDFDSSYKPIIESEDCTDMPTVLKKLRIIPTNNDITSETSLRIHFDVYNRNVQNFKKTSLPKPHFRIVCVDESSTFPSGADIAALNSKYDDDIPIVFAIVGFASVSYLRMNPTDLDIYIPTDLA